MRVTDDGVRDAVHRHRTAKRIARTEIALGHRLVDHDGGRHGHEVIVGGRQVAPRFHTDFLVAETGYGPSRYLA